MAKSNKPILEKSRPPISILDFDRDQLIRLLKEKLSGHSNIRHAYLFGSAASGKEDSWSDIDLVIVADTTEAFVERPRQFFDLWDIGIPVDILVYTPEEFDEMIQLSSGFWRNFRETRISIL